VQQLHSVGVTPDLKGLVLSARKGSKSGAYTVLVDDALLAQVEQVVEQRHERNGNAADLRYGNPERAPRPSADPVAPVGRRESSLTPREIQARIRAGYLVSEVAAEAGVDVDWVERFAVPIIAEQSQVLERALALTYIAPRRGPSALQLGESVAFVCSDKGLDVSDALFDRSWSAYQLRDNTWVVRFSYTSRKRPQHADWEVDLRGGSLEALNRQAAEFGYVAKGQRRRREVAEWVVGEQRETLAAAADVARAPARPARITKKRIAAHPVPVVRDAAATVERGNSCRDATGEAAEEGLGTTRHVRHRGEHQLSPVRSRVPSPVVSPRAHFPPGRQLRLSKKAPVKPRPPPTGGGGARRQPLRNHPPRRRAGAHSGR